MHTSNQRPKVGVGVIIKHNNQILLGRRINAHGNNSWAPPGGHLEFFESPEECAQREALEETGLTIKNVRSILFTNDLYTKENKHYITLFMLADFDSGELALLEPTKCEQWQWFDWQDLPNPLFLSFQNFLKKISYPNNLLNV
jgi:8-oxo-dGTP diphosphatase